MGKPVVHFEVGGKNRKQLEEFYARLFDWKIYGNDQMNYAIVDTGSSSGLAGGINGQIPEGAASWVTFYVGVDDLAECLAKMESLGGTVVVPPTLIPNVGSLAFFKDPQGNVIGLLQGQVPTHAEEPR